MESLNRQDKNLKHFHELNYEHLDANVEASRFSGGLQPLVEILTGFAMGVVIVVGGSMVLDGNLEWGVMVAFAMWIQRFFEPIPQPDHAVQPASEGHGRRGTNIRDY